MTRRACRALIRSKRPEDLERAGELLAARGGEAARDAEDLGLWADLLDAQAGRSPRAAAARVRAHMRAAQALGVGPRRPHHLKGLFRSLVRVAELEGNIPTLDPALEGSLLLEEAAKAHRRWRQGGEPEEAADAYQRALDGDTPAPLVPYVLFWRAHLLGVAGDEPGALAAYRRLLELGPPGKNGREDVRRRIAVLEERFSKDAVGALRSRLGELRQAGRLRDGVALLSEWLDEHGTSPVGPAVRKLRALTYGELGDHAAAIAEWEGLRGEFATEARVALRSLRARQAEAVAVAEGEAEDAVSDAEPAVAEAEGAGPEADHGGAGTEDAIPDAEHAAPGPGGAVPGVEVDIDPADDSGTDAPPEDDPPPREDLDEDPPGPDRARTPSPPPGPRALAAFEPSQDLETAADRARHQEDLARRLDEAGKLREAVQAYRRAYMAMPPGKAQLRLRKRVAAMAWHKLGDPVLAAEALAGLSQDARKARDVQALEADLHEGVVERFRRDVRLGLRVDAFVAVADLFRNLHVSEPMRKQLFQLHLDELSACLYRRWRLRREEVEGELQGFRARGLAGELVRLPNEAEGSPRHLAELEEELRILDDMGKALKAREWAVLRLGDQGGQARRLEDRDGIRSMDAILGFVREVAQRRVRHGVEKPVSGWRDRLAGILPAGARELFLSEGGRTLNIAQADLMGQFEAFLDLKYSPRRG